MLGYISSTRKKSCKQCVKAKRRCDLGYPCCKRCFSKSLDCAYPNASVREAEVVIRQQTPDLAPLPQVGHRNLVPGTQPAHRNTGPATQQASASDSNASSSDESWSDVVAGSAPSSHMSGAQALFWKQTQEPTISRDPLPHLWGPTWLNEDQLVFMVSKMRNFVPTLAFTGANLFIHPALYKSRQPAAFQDSVSLAALYLAQTKHTAPILARSIDHKLDRLIVGSKGWSLQEHLAAVQALIVYQIIRLFGGDPGQAEAYAKYNRLLEMWTARLWKRSFTETITFAKPWDAWVFQESLRRTVMMSVFMRGGWNAIKSDGVCDLVPTLAHLPLAEADELWSAGEEEFERRTAGVGGPEGKDKLISYGDYSMTWQTGEDLASLSEFQRLLLAPCRGAGDPRLYLDGM